MQRSCCPHTKNEVFTRRSMIKRRAPLPLTRSFLRYPAPVSGKCVFSTTRQQASSFKLSCPPKGALCSVDICTPQKGRIFLPQTAVLLYLYKQRSPPFTGFCPFAIPLPSALSNFPQKRVFKAVRLKSIEDGSVFIDAERTD